MRNVIEALICASERAANIARSCCSETDGDSLFVAEKAEGEANARFEKDFKTIADVLAQEAATTEISSRCKELGINVRGEESADIGGVSINLQESWEETAMLLSSIVPTGTAKSMSLAAHKAIDPSLFSNLPTDLPDIDCEKLGIWIDPIDGTAEFISGVRGEAKEGYGLPCVTVLIGAYLKETGEPVAGVINQPFYNHNQGRLIWGVAYNGIQKWSNIEDDKTTETILMSSAESPLIREQVLNSGWKVQSVPGAGHKLLKVVLGEAAAYTVSKDTTFRWDTCAPHAILKAKGGNILKYTTRQPITYHDPMDIDTQLYCNSEGIIAFAHTDVYDKIKNLF